MNWRDRLAIKREDSGQKCPDDSLPKLSKPPFVGFVSDPDGHSQTCDPAVRVDIRANLLALADRLAVDRIHVHRLDDDGLRLLAAIGGGGWRAYLLAAHDTVTRQAGKAPESDTAAIYCAHCGPVFVHPAIVEVLPVVAGWPRALGCPWCAIRKAGDYVLRPRVTCEACAHFKPDRVNPAAGLGGCASGHGMHYPTQRHGCASFKPPRPCCEDRICA